MGSSKRRKEASKREGIIVLAMLTTLVVLVRFSQRHQMHRALPSTLTGPLDKVVVITDNPFLIPKLPERRRQELLHSIRMNLDSPYVSSLHLLNLAPNYTLYPSDKLHLYDLGWRSTFLDAIRYANAVLPSNTAFVIANADIVFAHESVRISTRVKNPNVVIALSRHDVHEDGQATLHENPSQSQDAWFMRTPFPEDLRFEFPFGALGSDNKLAYLFKSLNKTVVNWCEDVIIWHLHSSQHRGDKVRLPRPYEMVPNTRVNISMLSTSWRMHTVHIHPRGPTVQVISMDLPRLTGMPMPDFDMHYQENRPEWSASTVAVMHSVAKRRLRKIKNAYKHRRAASMRNLYFLDVPWDLLALEPRLIRENELVQSLEEWMPSISRGQIFSLVPKDVVPDICHGAREWRELVFGVGDNNGWFTGELVCP